MKDWVEMTADIADIELDRMSHGDLVKLQKDVQKALATYQERRRQEALIEMQEIARKHGLELNEVMGGKKKAASVSAPKYRHPDNPSLTWAGRGRKPRWITEEINNGRSLEDFKV